MASGQDPWSPQIGAGTQANAEINVTPLVDVCLVLLIIFMVVTPMLQSGVDVNLPETTRPEKIQEGDTQISIALKADGQLFIGDQWVPKEHFARRMQDMNQQNPNREVRIKGDRYLPYKDIREIMKQVNEAGFTKAGLVTQKKGGSSQAAAGH
jgi:biopolymer transport protein TolR